MDESADIRISERFAALFRGIFGSWSMYTAAGTFALYFLGYLTLRFQLHALGVVTDLTALDERYFFAGARFLLYLATSLPIIFLFAGALAALAWPIRRFVGHIGTPRARLGRPRPNAVLVLGIFFSAVLIQWFMRPCFAFSNILLRRSLPEPAFLRDSILAEHDGFINLVFIGVVAGALLSGAILWLGSYPRDGALPHPVLKNALVLLVALQFAFLPINYGMLIVNRSLPRLADLGTAGLLMGRDAWLVWEGAEWVTYLLRDGHTGERRLLSLPRKDMKSVDVKCQDPILRILYLGDESPCASRPLSTKVSK